MSSASERMLLTSYSPFLVRGTVFRISSAAFFGNLWRVFYLKGKIGGLGLLFAY